MEFRSDGSEIIVRTVLSPIDLPITPVPTVPARIPKNKLPWKRLTVYGKESVRKLV
jgi:hypothetical protein